MSADNQVVIAKFNNTIRVATNVGVSGFDAICVPDKYTPQQCMALLWQEFSQATEFQDYEKAYNFAQNYIMNNYVEYGILEMMYGFDLVEAHYKFD